MEAGTKKIFGKIKLSSFPDLFRRRAKVVFSSLQFI